MRLALLIAAFTLFTAPLHAEVRWTLDCKVDKVGTLRLKGVEGDGDYAYLCLTVTNNTGKEVPLSLGAWADTDVAGRKYRGTNDPVVKEAVEKRTGKTWKTLEEVRGKLADKATAEVLISLGKIDPNVDELSVHVTGLIDRVYRDRRKTWVEDRALVLTLTRPGDEFHRQDVLLKLTDRRWKVLAEAKELRKV
jgi:hypothetical protein